MRNDYGSELSVYANKANFGYPNERKFIIDAKWWSKWCDYTSFDVNDHKANFIKVENEKVVVIDCSPLSKTPKALSSSSKDEECDEYKNAECESTKQDSIKISMFDKIRNEI
jgi:hypothetical protein